MDYGGMTVNERLYVSGKSKEYDKALKERDIPTLRKIFKSVDLPDISIDKVLEMEKLGHIKENIITKQNNNSVLSFLKNLFK